VVKPGLAENRATDVTAKERSARMATIANIREDMAERKGYAFMSSRSSSVEGQSSLVSLMSGGIEVGTDWISGHNGVDVLLEVQCDGVAVLGGVNVHAQTPRYFPKVNTVETVLELFGDVVRLRICSECSRSRSCRFTLKLIIVVEI
jgi:hypothetical protein